MAMVPLPFNVAFLSGSLLKEESPHHHAEILCVLVHPYTSALLFLHKYNCVYLLNICQTKKIKCCISVFCYLYKWVNSRRLHETYSLSHCQYSLHILFSVWQLTVNSRLHFLFQVNCEHYYHYYSMALLPSKLYPWCFKKQPWFLVNDKLLSIHLTLSVWIWKTTTN